MSIDLERGYSELRFHIGHEIAVVGYGPGPLNVAIECETCGMVLLDFDQPQSNEHAREEG